MTFWIQFCVAFTQNIHKRMLWQSCEMSCTNYIVIIVILYVYMLKMCLKCGPYRALTIWASGGYTLCTNLIQTIHISCWDPSSGLSTVPCTQGLLLVERSQGDTNCCIKLCIVTEMYWWEMTGFVTARVYVYQLVKEQ